MLIAYCRQCLAETQDKVVIAYGRRRADIDFPHDIHQEPLIRNGLFPIASRDWPDVLVEDSSGENVEETKANIVATYGERII